MTSTFFRVSRPGVGPVAARVEPVGHRDQGVDGRSVGGVLGVRVRNPGQFDAGDRGRRHRDHRLHVGRVAAGRADVAVLADLRVDQELLRPAAAHRPGHGRDDHVAQPEPVEDPDVSGPVPGVTGLQAGVVEVEGVGVLHHELPAAQQPGPGPGLVAVLGLDLVDGQRQVLVGGIEVADQQGEHLFVGGPEQVVGALSVLEPEQIRAVLGPSAGGLVGFPGQQRREVHLLRADRVHLLADHPLHVAQHPVAQRQPAVDAGGGAADESGPDQQLVAAHLGLGRILAERTEQQRGHPGDQRVLLCGIGGRGAAMAGDRDDDDTHRPSLRVRAYPPGGGERAGISAADGPGRALLSSGARRRNPGLTPSPTCWPGWVD